MGTSPVHLREYFISLWNGSIWRAGRVLGLVGHTPACPLQCSTPLVLKQCCTAIWVDHILHKSSDTDTGHDPVGNKSRSVPGKCEAEPLPPPRRKESNGVHLLPSAWLVSLGECCCVRGRICFSWWQVGHLAAETNLSHGEWKLNLLGQYITSISSTHLFSS